MKIREAAVAGLFYEADAALLQQQVRHLLAQAGEYTGAAPQALIVPHAGLIYSGPSAARAFRSIGSRAGTIERVVLFGPAHRVPLEGMALPATDSFRTPLGDIPLDQQSIARTAGLPGVCISDEAHKLEHSLEVQLPFLQTILGQFSLVPVVVGRCPPDSVAAVMDALWGGPETLVVISSDLSHFHNYEEAHQRDSRTCARLQARDSQLSGQDACGAHALNGLMRSQHGLSLEVELIDLCNSGDTAGTRDRVVGYGAFVLH